MSFNDVTVNEGGAFDLATSTFTAPTTGYYWLHWSVGMFGLTYVNVMLQGGSRTPNIMRNHTLFYGTPTTTSRDEIMYLTAGAQVWLSSTTSPLYSDNLLQTSFSGFLLDNLMNPMVAFMVGCSGPDFASKDYYRVRHNVVYVDTHNAWQRLRYEYVVPVSGVYVITHLTAPYSYYGDTHDLMSSQQGKLNTAIFQPLVQYLTAGTDMVSRTTIRACSQNDTLYTQLLYNGMEFYSDANYPTAFMGFLYKPITFSPIAWFVIQNSGGNPLNGPVDPFPWYQVITDTGSNFEYYRGRFVAPMAGFYYVHWSIAFRDRNSTLVLMHNNVTVADLRHEQDPGEYPETEQYQFSRAVIQRLAVGDTLHMFLPENYTVAAYGHFYPTFGGFCLYCS